VNEYVARIERERAIFEGRYELVKIYEEKIKTVLEKARESQCYCDDAPRLFLTTLPGTARRGPDGVHRHGVRGEQSLDSEETASPSFD